jgi:hypothetical protein
MNPSNLAEQREEAAPADIRDTPVRIVALMPGPPRKRRRARFGENAFPIRIRDTGLRAFRVF